MAKKIEEYSERCKVCINDCKYYKPAEIHYCPKFKTEKKASKKTTKK